VISSLARIPKILSTMSIAAATHPIAHNNGLEGVPVAWLLIMKFIKNQLSKPPTPSISDDSKTPVGSDFLSSCGFEREEKIQQKSSVNSSAILFSPIP